MRMRLFELTCQGLDVARNMRELAQLRGMRRAEAKMRAWCDGWNAAAARWYPPPTAWSIEAARWCPAPPNRSAP